MAEANAATPPVPALTKQERDVAEKVRISALGLFYPNERVFCMDGTRAAEHDRMQAAPQKNILNPEVGPYCVALLRRSLAAQRNPKELAEREELGLLAPYQMTAADKGFNGSLDNAQNFLLLYNKLASSNSKLANSTSAEIIPLSKGNGKPLGLTQGVAFDAGYSAKALGDPTPTAYTNMSPNELKATAEACFRNAPQVTMNMCLEAGRAQAIQDLSLPSQATNIPSHTQSKKNMRSN